MGLQMLGPGFERAGLGRQFERLIGPLQVLQQHTPGHTVHHQVVDHQQQTLAAVGQLRQHRAQQRAVFQVQATLRLVGDLLQLRQVGEVAGPQQLDRLWCLELGLPCAVPLLEAQPQGIVMFDQGLQGCPQVVWVELLAWLQQYRLVPVMALGNLRREEPLLDRRQRQQSGDRPLIDKRAFRAAGHRCQPLHRLMLEQVLRCELDTRLACPAHHLQRDDRVATQLEEVIGQPHSLQLEHVLPDRRDLLFQLCSWRYVGLLQLACVRLRQRLAVQLAVRGQW
ncbi:hypothetical protein D9M70_504390 [compost metagenome]